MQKYILTPQNEITVSNSDTASAKIALKKDFSVAVGLFFVVNGSEHHSDHSSESTV